MRGEPVLNRRVLVIDDNEAILADFRKILTPARAVSEDLLATESVLFGDPSPAADVRIEFELATATQGKEGLERVRQAAAAGRPFAMAFVDMRMPPGWDGLETIQHMWAEFPDLEIVICTAFSDYSWEETIRRLGRTDRLLIVKKPFDHVEVLQIAGALTQKWSLQRQADELLGNLGDLVRERTRELEAVRDQLLSVNGELLTAKEAAETANRSKTMFLASISHELRTPMTAIIGYAELLQESAIGRLHEHEVEALETIQRNAQHLVAIISDLLDLSKLDAGKLTVERVPCAPLRILAEALDLLRPRAVAKGLQLGIVYETPVPLAACTDPLRFRQVVVNLLDNAIKFTSAGSVTVRVALESGEQPRLAVQVADTGIGMSAEVRGRLFQPFEQADASTTRQFGGTGLGLAICRQLATLLGGGVRVDSEPGRGSTFTLTIATGPLTGVEMATDPAGVAARTDLAAPEAATAALGFAARILLVEDGADNQKLVSHLLRRIGCEVDVAGHGAECLERMAAAPERYDLVLMDMSMPVMDGFTAATELRNRGFTLPIVALTANAMRDDRELCLRAGCDAFLTKPIDRHRLYAELREQLRRRGAADGGGGTARR